jgi:hypothetical protein
MFAVKGTSECNSSQPTYWLQLDQAVGSLNINQQNSMDAVRVRFSCACLNEHEARSKSERRTAEPSNAIKIPCVGVSGKYLVHQLTPTVHRLFLNAVHILWPPFTRLCSVVECSEDLHQMGGTLISVPQEPLETWYKMEPVDSAPTGTLQGRYLLLAHNSTFFHVCIRLSHVPGQDMNPDLTAAI